MKKRILSVLFGFAAVCFLLTAGAIADDTAGSSNTGAKNASSSLTTVVPDVSTVPAQTQQGAIKTESTESSHDNKLFRKKHPNPPKDAADQNKDIKPKEKKPFLWGLFSTKKKATEVSTATPAKAMAPVPGAGTPLMVSTKPKQDAVKTEAAVPASEEPVIVPLASAGGSPRRRNFRNNL